jgi:hypothetical protein
MAISEIRTHDLSHQEAAELRLRPHGNRDHPEVRYVEDLLPLVRILSHLNPITVDYSLM